MVGIFFAVIEGLEGNLACIRNSTKNVSPRPRNQKEKSLQLSNSSVYNVKTEKKSDKKRIRIRKCTQYLLKALKGGIGVKDSSLGLC